MKSRLLIIIGIIVLGSMVILTINFLDDKRTTVSGTSLKQLEAIMEYCIDSKVLVDTVGLSYHNNTHFIDTITCEWQKYNGVQIDSEGLDSGWIAGEDYCSNWCDQEELVSMGCDRQILAHLAKHSNLFNEEFDGAYYINFIGLPKDVSVEKFNECVDFILEKRTLIKLEPTTIENLLIKNQINYLSDKLVVTSGISFQGDSGCGAVIDTDSVTHWFGIDSISKPTEITLFSENPNMCKVNTSSCFCSVQMKLTALTLDELSYFTIQDEEKFANILIDYLSKENINRTPKFLIGKLNINYTDSSAIGYCGEIWGKNTYGFFDGAIVTDIVMDYGISKKLPLLCAISDNAEWWERK